MSLTYPHWSLQQLKDALAAAGVRPSRKLGQSFLCDPQLLEAIVRDAEVAAGDTVLEVGAGAGGLTAPLLETGARVVAVEIDRRLAEILARRFPAEPRLEVLDCDMLAKGRIAPPWWR